jgi:outer membrane protein assembly factor BamD
LPRPRPIRSLLFVIVLALTLAGCASDNERDMKSGAQQIYERGYKAMVSRNYRNAVQYYEALTARFPFSNEAKQAQLDLIYCYYKNGETESALDATTNFERENPTHPRVDYALYMRGLATFKGQTNSFYRLVGIDLAKRPPDRARESFSAFSQLVQRYPNSPYAPDAKQRMVWLRNRLAEHENYVAHYYFDRRAYLAALDRAQNAVVTYDGAPAIAEALRIMIDSYRALGMSDLAEDTRKVLAASFPDAANAQAKSEGKPWYKFW